VADLERPATVSGLDVNEVRDGLIVYDPSRDRVHYLNATAAILFVLCDGSRDRAQLAVELQQAYGRPGPATAEVDEGLTHLEREGLLS
jgi:hypothetical protein